MNRKQFRECFKIAEALRGKIIPADERKQAIIALHGYAKERKQCTKRQYAIMINLQTMQMNGIRCQIALDYEMDYYKNVELLD